MNTCNENRGQLKSHFIQHSKYDYNEIVNVGRRSPAVPLGLLLQAALLPCSLVAALKNQNILGRAIPTVQSDGSNPAYFFTFMAEPVPVSSPQDPHHRTTMQ